MEIFKYCNVTIRAKLSPKKAGRKKILYSDFALAMNLEQKCFFPLSLNFEEITHDDLGLRLWLSLEVPLWIAV